jgi:hypothetical protein
MGGGRRRYLYTLIKTYLNKLHYFILMTLKYTLKLLFKVFITMFKIKIRQKRGVCVCVSRKYDGFQVKGFHHEK